MPELPEVETFRRKLEKALRGKTIKDVDVRPDDIIYGGKSPAKVKKAFLGAKIKKLHRKGKYIWFELSSKPWPVFHLGMTGSYVIADEMPDKKMKSVKLVLEMEDGTMMVFKDPRRFGRIFILEDAVNQNPLSNLGPDVLNELPTAAKIYAILQKKKAPIKAVLLDQSVLSGIGNWMADEILFQSRLSPHHPANEITMAQAKSLHAKIQSITKLAVNNNADDEKYPKTWLFHHRWGKKAGFVSTGDQIKHETVAGRSTAWVPTKQS